MAACARGPWGEYMAEQLRERLTPLVKNEIITPDEIDEIAGFIRASGFEKSNSFLHLDFRRVNMIYNGGACARCVHEHNKNRRKCVGLVFENVFGSEK